MPANRKIFYNRHTNLDYSPGTLKASAQIAIKYEHLLPGATVGQL